MARDDDGAPQPILRSSLIMAGVDAIVQGCGEMNMNPAEALTTAELALWTFMENGMKLSPNADILRQSKAQAARVIARIASRIEAWPAKTTERN